ncbi:MAG TPA: tetratricopeptide repeat protein [Caulobacteraceae bacterium]
MRSIFRLTPLLPAFALAACATSGPPPPLAESSIPPAVSGQSAYGLFLAGQSAINDGQGGEAAHYFARAAGAADDADTPLLRSHTFTAALLAGDVHAAASIAPMTDDDLGIRHLAGLTVAVDEMALGQGSKARAILTGADVGPPQAAAAALLAPLAAAEAGDNEAAIGLPVIDGDPVATFFANIDQGLIFERLHRYDEAETAYRSLIERGDPAAVASIDLGALLERRGRTADAVAIYDQARGRMPGDPTLLADKARAASRRDAPPLPTLNATASEALTAVASVLVIRRQNEGALAYLRLALRLDPDRDSAWLLVGDILSNIGDKSGAWAAYLTPKAGSADFVAARGKLAWSYQAEGRKDDALEEARTALAAEPESKDAATTLADLLRADERYEDSVNILDRLITREGDTPDWRLLYMRAVDFQQSDRWPQAESDLTLALKQQPDEPELLNFLGYSWIDRGEKLHEALAMVQKAVNTNPQSGAMIDSLGWAYYRLGDYTTAVEKLEQAVSLEAGDADVNNHLGDAYWRVGRRIEARFQWSRVLTLVPDAKLKTEVEAKLRNGLGPMDMPVSGS